MTTLFKKKDVADGHSVRREVRLTLEEDQHIRDAAALRQLNVSEFIRRAVLGRKADVRFEIDIVLMLIEVVKSIRELHSAVVATGALPPEPQWQPVISQAVAAMLRIEK